MGRSRIARYVKPVHIPSFEKLHATGIYFLHHEGKVVYVGQAVDMRRRVADHIGEGVKTFDAVSCLRCSQAALKGTERKYIELLRPKYNNCSIAKAWKALSFEGSFEQPSLDEIRPQKAERRRRVQETDAAA